MIALPSASYAQHALIVETLEKWNKAAPPPSNSVISKEIRETAASIYDDKPECTSTAIEIENITPATADRYAFNAMMRGKIKNAWFVQSRLPACDASSVRFMIIANLDSSFRTIRVNRGYSYAWDSLIGDTLPMAQLTAYTILKRNQVECDPQGRLVLGVVRIASEGESLGDDVYGARYSGTWSEVWPVEYCGRNLELVVNFTADGDGGAYHRISSEQVTLLD